jgi:A/G-specific adenine glycosylase
VGAPVETVQNETINKETIKTGTMNGVGDAAVVEVLRWAAHHGRDLPWRHTRDPWAVLVSEIMAQQTQVARVIPKWNAFLQRWPTPADCAAASLAEILVMWEGLGYPRRARNLHRAAQAIAERGSFPETLDELLQLPGVGPYTARAVLAFAFEQDVAVVDTNTARVLARWGGQTLDRRAVQMAADGLVPRGDGWAWNQALLDFGALICALRDPSCHGCPVSSMCAYHGVGTDPAIGTAGVSVPQSRFAGSDRQLRGKLLRALAAGPQEPIAIAARVGHQHEPQRVEHLINTLIKDGLVATADGVLRLGER